MTCRRKSIYAFNHIFPNLSTEEIEKFKSLYKNYYRLYVCHHWKFRRLRRIKLALEMAAIGLTTFGAIAGTASLDPIVLGCISGPEILIQAHLTKTNISSKVEKSRFAYTSYNKILGRTKGLLRGMSYDESTFLSDIKVIDDIIIDSCPNVALLFDTYNKKFTC